MESILRIMNKEQSERRKLRLYSYLDSSEWLAFKKAYKASGLDTSCRVCKTKKSIQFHHMHYDTLGEETFDDVICLCKTHHEALHKKLKSKGLAITDANCNLCLKSLQTKPHVYKKKKKKNNLKVRYQEPDPRPRKPYVHIEEW